MMTSIFLQAAPQGGSSMGSLIFIVGFFAIFYFFMIRPQMKRAKEQRKFQEAIKVGDRVVAMGGIHGEVLEIEDRTAVIKLDQGRMRVEKAGLTAEPVATEAAK
jgi:preprotein translocase subunit YajC